MSFPIRIHCFNNETRSGSGSLSLAVKCKGSCEELEQPVTGRHGNLAKAMRGYAVGDAPEEGFISMGASSLLSRVGAVLGAHSLL